MDIRKTDGGGIIGTPMEERTPYNRGPRSQYRLSSTDRIAPSKEVYGSLNQREQQRREKTLQDDAAIDALGSSNLYKRQNKLKSTLTMNDLMDEEDRANIRLGLRLRGARAQRQRQRSNSDFFPVPFAIAASEVPELVPRLQQTSIGHAMFRRSVETLDASRPRSRFSRTQPVLNDQYRLNDYVSFTSLGKKDNIGLGYVSQGADTGGNRAMIVQKGSKVAVIEEDEHPVRDDELDDFANAGYKDLDSASHRLQVSLLRQRRKANESTKEKRKRAIHIAGLEHSDKVLFATFERTGVLTVKSEVKPPLVVPAYFASKPVHDFDNDPYRVASSHLPERLQRECDMLAKRQQRIYMREERVFKAAIVKTEERRDEKLRKICEKFSVDMQSNFVASSQLSSTSEPLPPSTSRKNNGETISFKRIEEVGQSNRETEEWSPSLLLCKLMKVPAPENSKPKSGSGESKDKNNGWDGLPESDDESGFKVPAIIGADGHRVDLRSASLGLIADEEVIFSASESPTFPAEKSVKLNPSTELYSAIFNAITVTKEDRRKGESSVKSLAAGVQSSTLERSRGGHKTRATDFF